MELKDTRLKQTNQQTFVPTANMIKWVDTAIQNRTLSPTEVSKICGAERSQWYVWTKNKQFNDWFLTTWNEHMRTLGPALDIMGMKKAEHDHRYWQDMQKRAGNLQDPKTLTQYNVGGDMKVSFQEDASQEVT